MGVESTQKERAKAELVSIAPDITEGDRREYMENHGVSKTMLSNYLNGKVANTDIALDMLIFFRKKIKEREKLIAAEQ